MQNSWSHPRASESGGRTQESAADSYPWSFPSQDHVLLSLNYSEYPLEKPGEVSTSQCVAFGEGYDSFGGSPPD